MSLLLYIVYAHWVQFSCISPDFKYSIFVIYLPFMWLIRFHLVETRDYNKIDRLLKNLDGIPQRVSSMLLIKWTIIHLLEKKSWRRIAEQLSIPYLTLYYFFNKIKATQVFRDILLYLIDRRILLCIWEEKNITNHYLQGDAIIEISKNELETLFL